MNHHLMSLGPTLSSLANELRQKLDLTLPPVQVYPLEGYRFRLTVHYKGELLYHDILLDPKEISEASDEGYFSLMKSHTENALRALEARLEKA